jgi:hypothetical protein
MKAIFARAPRNRPGFSWLALGLALIAAMAALVVAPSSASAAQLPVNLGSAGNFAVLAATTVTSTGLSQITGDLGVSPGTAVTGFPPGTITGAQHDGDLTALLARLALKNAYNDAAGRTPATSVSGDLGGQTLTPGVYNSASSLGLTGTLTLDAQGDPSAVFIFQMGSTLITAAASQVVLTGGAQAANVFWQVGSSATLGTNSALAGNILAQTSITGTTGAAVNGRALAIDGAVTLDTNTVTATVLAVTGVLSITAPANAGLGSTAPGGTISAGLGTVQVTDNRGSLAVSWTATVSSTDFTTGSGTAAQTIPVLDARYLISGFTATTGSATFTSTAVTQISTAAQAVATASNVVGSNSASWNPVVQVAVPGAAVAGTYSATVTHSVS